MTRRLEKLREFDASGSDQRSYRIVEFRWVTAVTTLDGSVHIAQGSFVYRLLDGAPVNQLNDGTFQIVATGVRLKVS